MLPVIGGGSGDDAVEVIGVKVCFPEALLASGGAAIPIGALLRLAVVGGDDGFGFYGRLMLGAVAEVDDLFGMAESEAGVGLIAVVTSVGCGGGVSVAECGSHEADPGCS